MHRLSRLVSFDQSDAFSYYNISFAVVNLVEGIDVPAIEARIAQYQKENSEQIMNAQARKVPSKLCVSSFLCDM